MSCFGKWNTLLPAALLLAAAGGCSPLDSSPLDEEKEPHYVLGRSRVNAMDYDRAIQAFEESLEANPHSAQAHFQLAMLYENQESDPAAAIYHYQQYLKYDPRAENAEVIGQHIASCKQQLAADVLQLPSAPAAQQQLEKLTEENRRLHDQLTQWQAWYAAQLAAARTNPPAPQNQYNHNYSVLPNQSTPGLLVSPTPDDVSTQMLPGATSPTATGAGSRSSAAALSRGAAAFSATGPRTHVVARGETLASIARKQGISLEALEAANPAVTPRRLRAGQVLNLPTP
jgi:tetratricopeptide (TPR) repeat protein